jgi:hypothetical protein
MAVPAHLYTSHGCCRMGVCACMQAHMHVCMCMLCIFMYVFAQGDGRNLQRRSATACKLPRSNLWDAMHYCILSLALLVRIK